MIYFIKKLLVYAIHKLKYKNNESYNVSNLRLQSYFLIQWR